jgi:hypothetical protein
MLCCAVSFAWHSRSAAFVQGPDLAKRVWAAMHCVRSLVVAMMLAVIV